jgi:hypothetical protein
MEVVLLQNDIAAIVRAPRLGAEGRYGSGETTALAGRQI